jgi:hypothetical protein
MSLLIWVNCDVLRSIVEIFKQVSTNDPVLDPIIYSEIRTVSGSGPGLKFRSATLLLKSEFPGSFLFLKFTFTFFSLFLTPPFHIPLPQRHRLIFSPTRR